MYKTITFLKSLFAPAMAGVVLGSAIMARPAHAISASATLTENCADEEYSRAHPYKCLSFSTVSIATLGGAGLVGGAIALIGMSSSGGGSSDAGAPTTAQQNNYTTKTISTYRMVGADVDQIQLASITSAPEYATNYNQYNDIMAAYALARGYTGAGSKIAVLDTDGWHGNAVSALASGQIAPNAVVQKYTVADSNENFLSYREIGNVIAQANDANIYNASWSTEMRATEIYSRGQLEYVTNSNFVNQISIAATQRDAIFVWAAGNDSSSQSSALSAMPLVVPELQGHFVNVVAWDSETGTLASYSNQCGITKNFCITAPGSDLTAGNLHVSGTSFAAPVVSAAIAVIREAFPYMQSSEITALLFETARDLGDPGVDNVYGHGMLDLEKATRPVGVALVPTETGDMQPLTTARVASTIGRNIKSAGLKLAYFDKYGRAFDANLNDNIKVKNLGRAYAHLREDTDTKSANIGGLEFGVKSTDIILAQGFLQTDNKNIINFVGTTGKTMFGNLELFQKTQVGIAAPKASQGSMISDFSKIYTASINVGAKYQDWTFSVAIPDTIIAGNMTLRLPSGRATTGEILYGEYNIDLASKPAIEYALGYKYMTVGFIDNPYGTDEFYVIAKKSLRF